MFTGIVEEVGHVVAVERDGDRGRLHLACERVVADAAAGDSISVAGCCQTVTELPGDGFVCEMMTETLRVTALGALVVGDGVNLERPMRADTRLGGHLVQGHVDAVGEILGRDEAPGAVTLTVSAPAAVGRYLVPKGSVTVDGASLTAIEVSPQPHGAARFTVGLIPHTLETTTFGGRQVGDAVDLEADVIAKYVERLLAGGATSPYAPSADRRSEHQIPRSAR